MSNSKKRLRRAKRLTTVAVVILLINFAFSILFTRIIPMNCAYCERNVNTLSLIEYEIGPWKSIPCLHQECHKLIAEFLAPNSGMTVGQWLEIRGYKVRQEDISGLSWQELINREYEGPMPKVWSQSEGRLVESTPVEGSRLSDQIAELKIFVEEAQMEIERKRQELKEVEAEKE